MDHHKIAMKRTKTGVQLNEKVVKEFLRNL